MNKNEAIKRAMSWLKRTHLRRTPEEVEAYLNGFADANVSQSIIDAVEDAFNQELSPEDSQ